MELNIEELNEKLKIDKMRTILDCDIACQNQLEKLADSVIQNRINSPIICIAGPSGSCKTTTALALEKILDNRGFETHVLSLDHYFRTLSKEEHELVEQGEIDLESPERLDFPFLNEQLTNILKCHTVRLPKYDFKQTKRIDSGKVLKRKGGELVILEGIHALNPSVIQIPDINTMRVYVDVTTKVLLNNGQQQLSSSHIRLLRRLLRDVKHRKRSFKDTISMIQSVENGEKRFIKPFRTRAKYQIDTFFPYELGVYKNILLPVLKLNEFIDNKIIRDIIPFIELSFEIEPSLIPESSFIQEFIGYSEYYSY